MQPEPPVERHPEDEYLPPRADRVEVSARLARDYPTLTANDASAVDVLYVEAKASYDLVRDRLKSLDGKAGTLLGIVTTGFGAIALLGDPSKAPHGPWIVLSLVAFATAFGVALLVLAPRTVDRPDIGIYALEHTLTPPDNLARIKYELTLVYLRDAKGLRSAGTTKSARLKWATLGLTLGLAALAANFILVPTAQDPAPAIRVMIVATPSPSH